MQYFGSIYSYLSLLNNSIYPFSLSEPYNKASEMNRMWLMGANKIISLSIPVQGGRNNRQPLKDLRIADDKSWLRVHWRTIHDSYRKSPWFEEYHDSLQKLYQAHHEFLWQWNLQCTKWVFHHIKELNAKLTEIDQAAKPVKESLYSGSPTTDCSSDYPTYFQVFADRHGFVANLSILDLLMNEGPMSHEYLQRLYLYKYQSTTKNEAGIL